MAKKGGGSGRRSSGGPFKSAGTGRFVKKSTAQRHPDKTYRLGTKKK